MKKIFFLAFGILPMSMYAQQLSTQNVGSGNMFQLDAVGSKFITTPGIDTKGSPYFNEEYCVGNIKLKNGKLFKDINIKLNLQINKLVIKMDNGEELQSVVPIDLIEIIQCNKGNLATFRSGYPATGKQTPETFYQLLDSGKVQLLKYWNVNFTDTKPYGGGTIQRLYESSISYFAYSADKGMVSLGKGNESSVLEVLADKKADVSKYISSQNIRTKKEDDLTKIFMYYNSLGQ